MNVGLMRAPRVRAARPQVDFQSVLQLGLRHIHSARRERIREVWSRYGNCQAAQNLSGFVLCPVIRSERGRPLSMIFGFGCLQRCGTVCCVFTAEISTNIGRRRSSFHSGHSTSISVVGRGSKSLVTWNPEWITVLT